MLKTVNTTRPVILLLLLATSGLSGRAFATDISFTVSGVSPYCAGSPATLTYSSNSITFIDGNVFTAEISDAAGSFSSPLKIGTLASLGTSGTIDVRFPLDASGAAYRIRITSSNPSITSSDNGNDLVVNPTTATSISISVNGGNVLCDTHDATFNTTPTGGGTSPSYQWLKNGNPAGSNSAIYNGTGLEDGDMIFCKMTSNATCPSPAITSSNLITIVRKTTAAAGVTIVAPPNVCDGVSTQFTVLPSNGGTAPTYQWKKNANNVGANSSYTDNTLKTGDVLSVIMTSNRECLTTPTATSTLDIVVTPSVSPTIQVTADPSSPVGPGSVIYLSTTITGGGALPVFEWKRNGGVIGTTNALSLTNLNNGDLITARLTSNAPCALPSSITSPEQIITVDNTLTKSGHAWEPRASQPDVPSGPIVRSNASGFSIGSKGYIGVGTVTISGSLTYRKDLWEYDPSSDLWTQKADFPGVGRYNAVGFSVGTKGYIGTGLSATGVKKDFWQYDPTTNTWTQRADFPGAAREQAFAFGIGTKGYVGGGFSNGVGDFKDFYEFDPSSNTWLSRADFGGGKRMGAATFSIDQKGFVAAGFSSSANAWYKDLWDFDQGANLWTKRADLPGNGRARATGFSIAGNGYVGLGYSSGGYEGQFFQYTLSTNSWSWKPYYPGPVGTSTATGMSIGNRAFVYKEGKWTEFRILTITAFSSSLCTSETASINWDASGLTFGVNNTFTAQLSPQTNFQVVTTLGTPLSSQASTGTFNVPISASVNPGTYYFRIISSSPVLATLLETITITTLPSVHLITPENGATVCKDVPVTFRSNLTGTGFQWYKNNTAVGTDSPSYTESGLTSGDIIKAAHFYAEGCKAPVALNSNSISMTVKQPIKPVITVLPNTLQSTPAVAYQWYNDDNAIIGATAQSYKMTKDGAYKVRITDNSGCLAFSDEVKNVFVGLGDELISEHVSIFPNPVVNEMMLELSDDLVDKGCSYSVINQLGQIVVGALPGEKRNRINLTGYSQGLYLIRLSVSGEVVVRRIIKIE